MIEYLSTTGWNLVYSEDRPPESGYTGAWTRRFVDFGTPEPMSLDELITALAPDRAILEQHAVILNVQLWRYGTEEKSNRWALDITVYPRPDIYPTDAVSDPSWFWPQVSPLLSSTAWWDIFGKAGQTITQPITEILGPIMMIMVMGLMMVVMLPIITAQTYAPTVKEVVREIAPEVTKAAIPAAIAAAK